MFAENVNKCLRDSIEDLESKLLNEAEFHMVFTAKRVKKCDASGKNKEQKEEVVPDISN